MLCRFIHPCGHSSHLQPKRKTGRDRTEGSRGLWLMQRCSRSLPESSAVLLSVLAKVRHLMRRECLGKAPPLDWVHFACQAWLGSQQHPCEVHMSSFLAPSELEAEWSVDGTAPCPFSRPLRAYGVGLAFPSLFFFFSFSFISSFIFINHSLISFVLFVDYSVSIRSLLFSRCSSSVMYT